MLINRGFHPLHVPLRDLKVHILVRLNDALEVLEQNAQQTEFLNEVFQGKCFFGLHASQLTLSDDEDRVSLPSAIDPCH